jgi:uncharacterized protein (DUF885 family)
MKRKVFIYGVITTIAAAVLLFWGIGFIDNTDPLWFLKTIHPGVNSISLELTTTPGKVAGTTSIVSRTPVPTLDGEVNPNLSGLPFSEFLEESYTKLGLRYPEYMTELGVAEQLGIGNDKLDNLSDAYIRETHRLERDIYATLLTYDRSQLPEDEQRSFDIYKWYLDDLIAAQEYMYNDYPLSQFIFSVQNSTLHFFTEIHPIRNYADAEDYVTRLTQIDDKFLAVLDGLKIREDLGVILPRFLIQWTLRDLTSLSRLNARSTPYYQVFANKLDKLASISTEDEQALLTAAEKIIGDEVLPAHQALADYFTGLLAVATDDAGVWKFSNGDEYYAYMLKHFTTTDLSAEEIHQIGLQEVDRIEAEMRVIFSELGYPEDESIPALFERAAQDSGYLYGQDILQGYESIIAEANAVVRESFDLLPSSDVVVIEDEVGGFYVEPALDGSRPGAFYARATGQEPVLAMPTLAYHEAVPGHHLQIAIAQELDLPSFRRDSQFTAYTEGWALYAEYLAWELGLYEDDPYGNLGRLQAEMFRAVRLVVDTGIHAKHWSFDQAVDYMLSYTGQSEGMVQYQIARYIVWPGQAVAYKIGMMKIMELRQRAMDSLGEKFDIREFHNVILEEGAVPLPFLDQILDEYIEAKKD